MSRSYRKPYAANGGVAGAKDDKQRAARCVRRTQGQWLRMLSSGQQPDECSERWADASVFPYKLDCGSNNVYSWNRDGRQTLQVPSASEWSKYCRAQQGFFTYAWEARSMPTAYAEWPPMWYRQLCRK